MILRVAEEEEGDSEDKSDTSFTPRSVRNLQRAHKSMNTFGRQIQIATAKTTSNNGLTKDKKRERDNPETDQEKKKR